MTIKIHIEGRGGPAEGRGGWKGAPSRVVPARVIDLVTYIQTIINFKLYNCVYGTYRTMSISSRRSRTSWALAAILVIQLCLHFFTKRPRRVDFIIKHHGVVGLTQTITLRIALASLVSKHAISSHRVAMRLILHLLVLSRFMVHLFVN